MKEYICEDEGISINVTETEDVCPNRGCGGRLIDVDSISVGDWKGILENQINNIDDFSEMKDIDDYLKVVEEIKKLQEKES